MELGLDPVNLLAMVDEIFQDSSELLLEDFVEAILRFRCAHGASMGDVISLRNYLEEILSEKPSTRSPSRRIPMSVFKTSGSTRIRNDSEAPTLRSSVAT